MAWLTACCWSGTSRGERCKCLTYEMPYRTAVVTLELLSIHLLWHPYPLVAGTKLLHIYSSDGVHSIFKILCYFNSLAFLLFSGVNSSSWNIICDYRAFYGRITVQYTVSYLLYPRPANLLVSCAHLPLHSAPPRDLWRPTTVDDWEIYQSIITINVPIL